MFTLRKLCLAIVAALGLLATQVLPAFACGALVAPNGAIRLSRATTLVAWHDGIEHYMTSCTYQVDKENPVSSLGWIIPLPAVPLKIEEGGAWTLQRLFRETHPLPAGFLEFARSTAPTAADQAQVLQKLKVAALNITVVRGSGNAIVNWALNNGFTLD